MGPGVYSRRMRWSFRAFFALFLSICVIYAGGGCAPLQSSAIEHDMGIEATVDASSKVLTPSDDKRESHCIHGCAGHIGGHLVSITANAAFPAETATDSTLRNIPSVIAVVDRTDYLFRPPRLLVTA